MNTVFFLVWLTAVLGCLLAVTARVRSRHADQMAAAPPVSRSPAESRPVLGDVADLDGSHDERLGVCPACGMADPGNLDGSHLGWPAHSECVEWLGDWKPPAGTPRVPRKADPIAAANAYLAAMKTINETRHELVLEGMERKIAGPFGIPPPIVGTTEPAVTRWCTCGDSFKGTEVAIHDALGVHHRSGECPHSVAGRQQQGRVG